MNNQVFQNHYSRKRFGQNFLKNEYIIEKIISFINPQKGEILVEIGPGLGALTIPISDYLDTMTVVELDRNLALRLQNNPFLRPKLTVYQQDVMTFDFLKLAQEKGQSLRIFGNLPYNISTPLMFYLFNYISLIKDMHFMLQKEVVNRLVALPGSKNYSRLSVISQYYCQTIQMLEVPSSSFRPKPKVDSALVRQIPFTKSPYPIIDIHLLRHITTVAFGQRRKTLRNSLKHIFSEKILDKLNISSSLRAENVTVAQYCTLANWLGNHLGLD